VVVLRVTLVAELLEQTLSVSVPPPQGEKAAKGAGAVGALCSSRRGLRVQGDRNQQARQGERNLLFHNGRASQENMFSELKDQCQMDYVPVRRLAGNQWYFLSAVIAHNLFRELHIKSCPRDRATTAKRSPLWSFREATTIRQRLLHRAGRLTRPQGQLRLTLSGNEITRQEFQKYLAALSASA